MTTRSELKQQADSEQYGVGNHSTSFYEQILLAEDDEIFNDTDEQVDVKEDDATQRNDEYHQGEDWKQEGSHILERICLRLA